MDILILILLPFCVGSAIDSMDSNRKFTSDLSSQDFMETPDLRNENSNTSKMEEEDDTFKLLKDSGRSSSQEQNSRLVIVFTPCFQLMNRTKLSH